MNFLLYYKLGSEVAPKRLRQNFFMAKNLIVFSLSLIICFILSRTAVLAANQDLVAGSSAQLSVPQLELRPIIDVRTQKLTAYFSAWQSPLTPYAGVFINSADKYQLDWTLVAAISGVESGFGKHIPYESYNAWGWNNGNYQFQSWEHGIDHVHQVLKEKYYDRGLQTPWQMGTVYAPPSSTWARKVEYFTTQLDEVILPASVRLALNLD